MDMLPITPERKAELDDYAKRHGQNAETALNDVLAEYFSWERQEYREAIEGIKRGHEDIEAGHARLAADFFEELRGKHGFPR